jgi:hypothetical protein
VNHYGFQVEDASNSWTQFNETSPNKADEAINLSFFFDFLDPGASVSFTWVYILRVEDLITAMGQVCRCIRKAT